MALVRVKMIVEMDETLWDVIKIGLAIPVGTTNVNVRAVGAVDEERIDQAQDLVTQEQSVLATMAVPT